VNRALRVLLSILLAGALVTPSAVAQVNVTPKELEEVRVQEHLGAELPHALVFDRHDGARVSLGSALRGTKPTILVFAYHRCPMLCSFVIDGLLKGLKGVSATAGEDFNVVSVSIDPRDNPESATKKREQILGRYGRTVAPEAFTFLTGDEPSIKALTKVVGFDFTYDARQDQYAHPAAVFLVSPTGHLTRYLYGIVYEPEDLKLAIIEAKAEKARSTVESLLLYCYHYDPQGKRYGLVAMRVMRLGGLVTVLALGTLLATLWRFDRRKTKAALQVSPASSGIS
jgi:protein SCO1/2